jgi:hypothetical protein
MARALLDDSTKERHLGKYWSFVALNMPVDEEAALRAWPGTGHVQAIAFEPLLLPKH